MGLYKFRDIKEDAFIDRLQEIRAKDAFFVIPVYNDDFGKDGFLFIGYPRIYLEWLQWAQKRAGIELPKPIKKNDSPFFILSDIPEKLMTLEYGMLDFLIDEEDFGSLMGRIFFWFSNRVFYSLSPHLYWRVDDWTGKRKVYIFVGYTPGEMVKIPLEVEDEATN